MNSATPSKIKPAVIAGVVSGAAAAIPPVSCLNLCCCALIIGGGFLATFLYLKEAAPTVDPPYGDGAILGLLTGVIAAPVAMVVAIPINMAFSGLGFTPDTSQLQEMFDQTEIPPEIANLIEGFMSGGGLTIGAMLISLAVSLVAYSIFGTLGGIIGAAVLHKKQAPPPPAPTSTDYASGPVPPPPPV